MLVLLAGFAAPPADAGFRSPESLVRNVYAHYGSGAAELSKGLPRTAEAARQFFDPSLHGAWTALQDPPYDFLVQSETVETRPGLDRDPAKAVRQDLCRGFLRQ